MLENNQNLIPSANAVNISSNSGAFVVTNKQQDFIIDIRATNHMTSTLEQLNKHTITDSVDPRKVVVSNGDFSQETYTDTCNISNKI